MPIKRAAVKAIRKDARKRLRNVRLTSELRTLTKQFEELLTARQHDQAMTRLGYLIRRIDQARAKGVLHANTAARKKSRLSARLARSRA